MVAGQVLHEANSPIAEVFFVENGVISLTADTRDLGRVEVGLLGREGFAGASVLLNADPWSVHRAFSQVPGEVCRMSSEALRSAVEQSQSLRERCLRHVEMLMVQTSQVAACNARHNLPERLARWLLMVRDRTDSDIFHDTGVPVGDVGCPQIGSIRGGQHASGRRPRPDTARACSHPRSRWSGDCCLRLLPHNPGNRDRICGNRS